MSDIDWKRLVIVAAVHGEKYLGWLPDEPLARDFLERGPKGGPIKLLDVRNLIGQSSPQIGPGGTVMGFTRLLLLMPIDTTVGPVPELYVIPSTWYFPGDHGDEAKEQIKNLLKHAVDGEERMRARMVGIHLPGQQ